VDLRELGLGFSSCPNDTFMFHGLMSGDVPVPGLRFRAEIADIEALNLRALGGVDALPITKLSASTLAQLCDRYCVLQAGAALGRGCGPLVVEQAVAGGAVAGGLDSGSPADLGALAGRRVAVPGLHTTAYLLLRLFFAEASERAGRPAASFEPVVMRFDEIMPAIAAGRVDAGLIIHESRFTYASHGLVAIADLGVLWEGETGLPLPLGMICAQRELAPAIIDAVEDGLRSSVRLAFAEPQRSRAWIREHAQEIDDEVCRRHIALYVNEFSVELGEQGREAIELLIARGRAQGLVPPGPSPWRGGRR